MQTATQGSVTVITPAQRRSVDHLRTIEVENDQGVSVYASLTCYFIAKLYRPLQRRLLISKALKAFKTPCSAIECGPKLRVLSSPLFKDFDAIWAIQEGDSIAFVFPEDL